MFISNSFSLLTNNFIYQFLFSFSKRLIIKSILVRKEIEKFPKGESFTITGFKFTIDEKIPVVDIIGLDLGELKTLGRRMDLAN